jgi:hypothetical protein
MKTPFLTSVAGSAKRHLGLTIVVGAALAFAPLAKAWMVLFPTFDEASKALAPVKPGPETEALKPLVGAFSLTGALPEKILALDQPELSSEGVHFGRWVMNNNFVECEIKDVARNGANALPWSGHVLIGYDVQAKKYRAAVADSQGTLGLLEGNFVDKKLVLELISPSNFNGRPFKYRLTFDLTDPNAIGFNSEVTTDSTNWVLTERKSLRRIP